jgi:hypothetical protein
MARSEWLKGDPQVGLEEPKGPLTNGGRQQNQSSFHIPQVARGSQLTPRKSWLGPEAIVRRMSLWPLEKYAQVADEG